MKKLFVLTAVFLLAAGMGAAADRHGPLKTGLFEVQIDDGDVKGWQSVTIPGKSIEQDSSREGNDEPEEKNVAGKPSFDDLEMERGVNVAAANSGTVKWFDDKKGYGIVVDIGGSEDIIVTFDGDGCRGGDGGDGADGGCASVFAPLAEPEPARENGRKTVRPEDLVTVVIPNNGNLPGFPANWDLKTVTTDENGDWAARTVATFNPGKNLAEAVK